ARRPQGGLGTTGLSSGDLLPDDFFDHVSGDVADFFAAQLAFEGGHTAASVGHLFFGAGLSFGQWHGPQVRTAVATVAGGAVADGAFFGEHFFACRRVGGGTATGRRSFFAAFFFFFTAGGFGFFRRFFGFAGVFLTAVFGAFAFFFGACLRAHRPFQGEDPEVFAVRRRRQRVTAGVDGDFLFAFVFERGHRRVGAGAGLEAPEFFAGFDVERLEFAVVLAHEDQATGGRDSTRVTGFGEFFVPDDFAGRHVVAGQEPFGVEAGGAGDFTAAEPAAFGVRGLAGFGDHAQHAFLRADDVDVLFRVVGGGRPVVAADRPVRDQVHRAFVGRERLEDLRSDDLLLAAVRGDRFFD